MSTVILLPVKATPTDENFLERFGDWIEGLFSEADKLYNELTVEEKAAAVWGSGVIAAVNHDLEAAPADVIKLIESSFPGLSLDNVHGFLDELLNAINNIQGEVPLTLEDAIVALQKYLKQYNGSIWGIISGTAATILSTLISPETAIEKFINIATDVYHSIVKIHVTGVAASLAVTAKAEAPSGGADNNIGEAKSESPAGTEEKEPPTGEVDADMQISNEAKEQLAAGSGTEDDSAVLEGEQQISYDEQVAKDKAEAKDGSQA